MGDSEPVMTKQNTSSAVILLCGLMTNIFSNKFRASGLLYLMYLDMDYGGRAESEFTNSMAFLFLINYSKSSYVGFPSVSKIILTIYTYVFPLNNTYIFRYFFTFPSSSISANVHPNDHISIGKEYYCDETIISGAL